MRATTSPIVVPAEKRVPRKPPRRVNGAPKPVAAEYLRGERMIAFIEEHLRVPEGMLVGKPFLLLPEQKDFLRKLYRTRAGRRLVRRAIFSKARKNGKTGLIGAIVDGHLIGPEALPNSNIYSAARSRAQAAQVYNYAHKAMQLNPRLDPLYRSQYSLKALSGVMRNVTYKALSAEATTAHGLSPALSIHDELGQVVGPIDPLYDALETAGGAYDEPLSLIISTQAASDGDLLSVLIDDALRANDERFLCVLFTAPTDANIFDERTWRKANFALGEFRSLEEFREAAARAKRIPSFEATFRNLYLNQRVSTVALYMAPSVWRENDAKVDEELFEKYPVHLGIDLSQRTDLTAIVASVQDPETGKIHVKPFVYTPSVGVEERARLDRAPYLLWIKQGHLLTIPGRVVEYAQVVAHAKNAMRGWNISTIAFDRWRIDLFKVEAERQGFAEYAEWKPVGQGFKDMSPRLEYFEEMALNAKLAHGSHPLLNLAASAAIAVFDPAKNRKLEKAKSTARIDALVAAVMSVGCFADYEDAFTSNAVMIM